MPARKRHRASVVAERYGQFLLVRERGARRYTLPVEVSKAVNPSSKLLAGNSERRSACP